MRMPTMPGVLVKENDLVKLDYSNANDGYITAWYKGSHDRRFKVKIEHQSGQGQNFDADRNGYPTVMPLCYGDGDYRISYLYQIQGKQYQPISGAAMSVYLSSPHTSFLYPNTYAYYDSGSDCVAVANQLCAGMVSTVDKIAAIYQYIIDTQEYDFELARRLVETGEWWIPDPDEVIYAGKTICFGYSSLFAAMCRCLDIPCKIVVGQAANMGCHAWNEVYSDSAANIDGIMIKAHDWTRLDITSMDAGHQTGRDYALDCSNFSPDYYG